jgi:hypothetical protein
MFIKALHLLEVSHLFAQETAGALLAKHSPALRQRALISEESNREFRQKLGSDQAEDEER